MAMKDHWTSQQEAKLIAWHKMQQLPVEKPGPCFTISREFGCQAYPIAEALVALLNAATPERPWVVIGKQVLDEVARLSGFSVEQIEKSQDTPSSLKAIFSMFLDSSHAEETEVFVHMREALHGFARRGNCVIVGRGGVFATQDLPNCIHLRLVAPEAFRVQKIMESHHLTRAEAGKYIALHQKQRDDFIKRFAGGQIENPLLYHLIINNSKLPVDQIAALIDAYRQKLPGL